VGARFMPPPEGIPSPLLWGDAEVVKERLSNGASEVRTARQEIILEFPFGPNDVVQFFREYFGPTRVIFSKLDPQGQADYAAELERLWREHNELGGNGTRVRAEYLEVVALRA
jgi:hypothetical protein